MGIGILELGHEISEYFASMLKFYNIKFKKRNKLYIGLGIGIAIFTMIYFNSLCIINIVNTNKTLANVVEQLEIGYKNIDKNSTIQLQGRSNGSFRYCVSVDGIQFFITLTEDGSEDKFDNKSVYYSASYEANPNTGEMTLRYGNTKKQLTIDDIEESFKQVHSNRKRFPFFYKTQKLSNLNIEFSDEMKNQLQNLKNINKKWNNKYKIDTGDNTIIEITEEIQYRDDGWEDELGYGSLDINYSVYYRNAYSSEINEKKQ